MSIRKTLLFGGTVMAALAMTAPVAQAGWLHDHEAIVEPKTIHMEGFVKVDNNAGDSFGCPMTMVMVAEPGSTGKVTEFKPTTTTECTATGAFANCDLQSHASVSLPWTVHANTDSRDIVVTNLRLTNVYSNCDVPTTEARFPEVTLTPDDPNAISTIGISGGGTLFAFHIIPAGAVELKGSMHFTEPNEYGVSPF